MYFESRSQAGQIIADSIFERYRYENCVVVALNDGGVLVGEQIAIALHCLLTLLVVEDIQIPGEGISFGAVSQSGELTYNESLSSGEIDEYNSEYHGFLEEKKREAFQTINRLLGDGGLIDKDMLRDHVVILVSDGLDSGTSIDVALDFLKPLRLQRLVIATPLASVPAVDKIHIAADELCVLDVKDNYMGVDHYYVQNDIPSHQDTVNKINNIVLNWR